jgi:hypothetical protein
MRRHGSHQCIRSAAKDGGNPVVAAAEGADETGDDTAARQDNVDEAALRESKKE